MIKLGSFRVIKLTRILTGPPSKEAAKELVGFVWEMTGTTREELKQRYQEATPEAKERIYNYMLLTIIDLRNHLPEGEGDLTILLKLTQEELERQFFEIFQRPLVLK